MSQTQTVNKSLISIQFSKEFAYNIEKEYSSNMNVGYFCLHEDKNKRWRFMPELHLFFCDVSNVFVEIVIDFKYWKNISSIWGPSDNAAATDMKHFKFNLH